MTEILTARDISAVFRFLKTRGFSRAAISAATGLSETRVRQISLGRQQVRDYEVFERIALGLAIDRGLLGLAYGVAMLGQDSPTQLSATGLDAHDLSMHLNELLALIAGRTEDSGVEAVWNLTRRQLTLIDAQRRAWPNDDALLATQARWSEFASWVADNLGRHDAARQLAELALSQATEAGNVRTASYVLMRQAQQAAERRHAGTAVALADRALTLAVGSPRTSALCLVRRAHGVALAGDARAARRAGYQAVRLVDRADGTESDPLDGHCTTLYVAAHEGLCSLLVGDAENAVQVLEDVLAALPGTPRQDEVLWRAWLTEAYATTGRLAEASSEGLRALDLVRATGSTRALGVLDTIADTLISDDHVAEVNVFLAAMVRRR